MDFFCFFGVDFKGKNKQALKHIFYLFTFRKIGKAV